MTVSACRLSRGLPVSFVHDAPSPFVESFLHIYQDVDVDGITDASSLVRG